MSMSALQLFVTPEQRTSTNCPDWRVQSKCSTVLCLLAWCVSCGQAMKCKELLGHGVLLQFVCSFVLRLEVVFGEEFIGPCNLHRFSAVTAKGPIVSQGCHHSVFCTRSTASFEVFLQQKSGITTLAVLHKAYAWIRRVSLTHWQHGGSICAQVVLSALYLSCT